MSNVLLEIESELLVNTLILVGVLEENVAVAGDS
jgi:hypothetical protein